jgi:hypothetical protein
MQRGSLLGLGCAALLVGLGPLRTAAAPADLERFAVVESAPGRTSIYVGTVTFTLTPFIRQGGQYAADYQAKVFPFFFYSEHGRLVVTVSDAQLRRIADGQPIEFTGQGVNADGAVRSIDGRAIPRAGDRGELKVRIHLGHRLTLVFNTTYRLPKAATPSSDR